MSIWTAKKDGANGIEDMVLLSKVTDDQIVENLRKRSMADLMFTYIGPVLVAVNPYKKLPYFTEKEIDTYRGANAYEHMPHIWAVADKMFQNMVSEGENQCVIISGESGAGKTECAKLIMNYIAAVSGGGNTVVEQIKRIILESNPLLESFGNAKTLRNNNSSRFGKYFEINFNRGGAPTGGQILNFLLEKSRVVGPGKGERNFHVFYQLTKATSGQERENLGMMDPKSFKYLNVSKEYNADGIDDAQEYKEMRNAMNVCSINQADQANIMQIAAAVLHLGNIDFVEEKNNAQVRDPGTLSFPAYLLGVSEDVLRDKVTSRIMTTGGFGKRSSNYQVPLNVQQAQGTRDALAKVLYSRMFDWIVQAVNTAMKNLSSRTGEGNLCLGVLDIFGFEIFEQNGFEQFCINYVNEKLQQIFIELTLKSEQEEYVREGIQWTPIDYFNNKIVVDLIESKRPPGIMAILDDVCFTMHAVTEGADQKFVQKLDESVAPHKHYQGLQNQFIIHHYAGSVTYECDGFTEANKDTLFKDLIQLMQSTNNHFIKNLFPEQIDDQDKKRPTTVSFKIKNQSQELVDTLMKCTPSYVRTIKPNETKRPKDFDSKRVEHQVRYLNLKENIKVRRAGFAYRVTFDRFMRRFGILTDETFPQWHGPVHEGIAHIMLGKSKIFIKSPESLFLLEEVRERKYHHYAKIIQRAYRSWKSRKYFIELRKKAADVMYNHKERKRMSLNRIFRGDYVNYLDNPVLKNLLGKTEKVGFGQEVTKYDRKFKPSKLELLITETAVYLIGLDKAKDGPNKGKLVKAIKRKIPLSGVGGISVSTKADDFFVLHVPSEYDNVLQNMYKTELITVLSEKYEAATGRKLQINFEDKIKYSLKKTSFQGGGAQELTFITDAAAKNPVPKPSGKGAEIRVHPGLPADSRPTQQQISTSTRRTGGGGGGYKAPSNNKYNTNNNSSAGYSMPPRPSGGTTSSAAPSRPTTSSSSVPSSRPNVGGGMYGGGAPPSGGMYGGGARPGSNSNIPSSISHSNIAATATPYSSNNNLAASANAAGAAKKKAPPPVPPAKKLPTVKALYDYNATEADELSFRAGEMITVISKDDAGWWTGSSKGKKGLFPANYVQE
ncbi:hypothetical protein SmJEL517_g02861 [Synchytrium microbalum]|uniref:Myosin motor domain-containing protein n=1 Tax=Synchytrium microbalum TaxID=1806994 RepID=A0A507C960_9FUNG|nr:uncharacterized protein SmJEL517_g02861 [Synchytrium microbalum]TPX34504.1 hypothetical protein SmJEL517_g02861 [Synchytrium microbalum]